MPIDFKEQRERNDEYLNRTSYSSRDNEITYLESREYKIIDDYNVKYKTSKPILNKIK